MSTNSSPKLKYPYKWGYSVCQTFLERYPRGRRNFATLLDVTVWDVGHKLTIVLCSGKSVKFETLKRAIKILDDYDQVDIARFSANDRKLLYKWLVYLCTEDELDSRTARDALDMVANKTLPF